MTSELVATVNMPYQTRCHWNITCKHFGLIKQFFLAEQWQQNSIQLPAGNELYITESTSQQQLKLRLLYYNYVFLIGCAVKTVAYAKNVLYQMSRFKCIWG